MFRRLFEDCHELYFSSPPTHCNILIPLSTDCWLFQVSIYLIQIIFGAVDFPAKLFALAILSYLGRRLSQSACLFLSSMVIFANIFIPTGNSNHSNFDVHSHHTYSQIESETRTIYQKQSIKQIELGQFDFTVHSPVSLD